MYYVVFEYTKEAGGYYGNRYRVDFTTKAKFGQAAKDQTKVIAEGISDFESLSLTSQTPEIARIGSAIHEACYDDGKLDAAVFGHHVTMSCFAISHDRKFIWENGIIRTYEFEPLVIENPQTDMEKLLKLIYDNCYIAPYGLIDLDRTLQTLQTGVARLMYQKAFNGRLK